MLCMSLCISDGSWNGRILISWRLRRVMTKLDTSKSDYQERTGTEWLGLGLFGRSRVLAGELVLLCKGVSRAFLPLVAFVTNFTIVCYFYFLFSLLLLDVNQSSLCLFSCHAVLDPELFYPDALMDRWPGVVSWVSPNVRLFALLFVQFTPLSFFRPDAFFFVNIPRPSCAFAYNRGVRFPSLLSIGFFFCWLFSYRAMHISVRVFWPISLVFDRLLTSRHNTTDILQCVWI